MTSRAKGRYDENRSGDAEQEDAMGLFDKRDKKRKDDFDSPVESIDLSAAAPEPVAEVTAERPAPAAEPSPPMASARARQPDPDPEPDDFDTSFGIEKAIELMRTLPSDNVELVVQVVKLTLESTKIKIAHIIEDATRKQDDIQGRIKVLNAEIADFEKEIAQRKEEIGTLEADFTETSTVKERVVLAETLTDRPGAARPVARAAAPTSPASPASPAAPRPTLGGSPAGKSSVLVKK
jgi:hypothetical protein